MKSVGGSSIAIFMTIQGGRGMWWFGVCGLDEFRICRLYLSLSDFFPWCFMFLSSIALFNWTNLRRIWEYYCIWKFTVLLIRSVHSGPCRTRKGHLRDQRLSFIKPIQCYHSPPKLFPLLPARNFSDAESSLVIFVTHLRYNKTYYSCDLIRCHYHGGLRSICTIWTSS